ncbi:M19 familiy membrane dipeptidase [Gottschalkia acidurici 9a]|uniref:M19 familiy membrane dipeptidase n=1 Tax=Gottschalkia acidurici (strain ATCC 7906 / DSM 604 / BCRC 14475 / CIP 104303 / KCTC 5404 / NCIMB 10678 / 9a) TaxID=1128398 RepID=K0AWM6_GOTA9|nr:membrane dipeptidase [Gottschalkia acidurici]AFS77172.1 M19 familiy membrane dipeptidase [Gottschalkia acidurici 9a]
MIFDGHADIWIDVADYRKKGMKDVFKNRHLDKFKSGNINGGIFVIWIDPYNTDDSKKRLIEIMEYTSTEIIENREIFKVVKDGNDLDIGLRENKMPIVMGIEGLKCIEENIDMINLLYMYGIRHASLTWNEENRLATGVNGRKDRGLTKLGFEAIKKMERMGMIIDVSHANEKTFWDIYNNTRKPFIASHSNCISICNCPRNLTNNQIKAIGERNGVIGINIYRDFIHVDSDKQNIHEMINHIEYIINLIGIDHIGFGFDFCEYLEEYDNEINISGVENASKVQNIIEQLRYRGFSQNDIEKISYKNFERVIKEVLV